MIVAVGNRVARSPAVAVGMRIAAHPCAGPELDFDPSGSYLGNLTAHRCSVHGWWIIARGKGNPVMHSNRIQSMRQRWDLRRTARVHRRCSLRRNVRNHQLDTGTA